MNNVATAVANVACTDSTSSALWCAPDPLPAILGDPSVEVVDLSALPGGRVVGQLTGSRRAIVQQVRRFSPRLSSFRTMGIRSSMSDRTRQFLRSPFLRCEKPSRAPKRMPAVGVHQPRSRRSTRSLMTLRPTCRPSQVGSSIASDSMRDQPGTQGVADLHLRKRLDSVADERGRQSTDLRTGRMLGIRSRRRLPAGERSPRDSALRGANIGRQSHALLRPYNSHPR